MPTPNILIGKKQNKNKKKRIRKREADVTLFHLFNLSFVNNYFPRKYMKSKRVVVIQYHKMYGDVSASIYTNTHTHIPNTHMTYMHNHIRLHAWTHKYLHKYSYIQCKQTFIYMFTLYSPIHSSQIHIKYTTMTHTMNKHLFKQTRRLLLPICFNKHMYKTHSRGQKWKHLQYASLRCKHT